MATTRSGTTQPETPQAFCSQQPDWSAAPDDPRPGGTPLEYGTIEVPRDYADPGGERITLAVSRRRAADPARRRGILLVLNGGPGGDWGQGRDLVNTFVGTPVHDVYDLIGFDARGTGSSTRLYAEVAVPEAPFDSRPPDSEFETLAEDMRRRELACARGGGALRRHISTRNTARDMDVIRGVLGEERLNFVGYAYGTYAGAVYGSMFPARLDRSVLDSCVNPEWTWHRQFLSQGEAIRRNVDQWAGWTSERNGRFGLGTTPRSVLDRVEDAVSRLEALPDGIRLRTLLDGAMGYRTADRGTWAELAGIVARLQDVSGAEGAATADKLLSDQRGWRPSDNEGDLRIGVLDAITLEHDWPTDLESYFQTMRDFRTRFPYGYGILRAQPWVGTFRTFTAPEEPATIARDGYPVGLVVQSEGDIMDHFAGGLAMAERLGHHLITVEDSGEHEVYLLCGNQQVDAHVNRYLVEGVLPPRRTVCAGATPRPDVPADSEAAHLSGTRP